VQTMKRVCRKLLFTLFLLVLPYVSFSVENFEIKPQTGSSGLLSIDFLPGGRFAVLGDDDHYVRVWDIELGKEIRKLYGHSGEVTSVAGLGDLRAISADRDGSIRVWDVEAGKELRHIESGLGGIELLRVLPDSKRVLSGHADGTAALWDLESGRMVRLFAGHTEKITAACFSPDGKTVCTGSDDGTAMVWDTDSGRELYAFGGHQFSVYAVCFSLDGNNLITTGNRTVYVWDLLTGEKYRTAEIAGEAVQFLTYHPQSGKLLYAGVTGINSTDDGLGSEFDLRNPDFSVRSSGAYAFDPDTDLFLTIDYGKVRVIELKKDAKERVIKLRHFYGFSPLFSPVEDTFIFGTAVSTASWDLNHCSPGKTYGYHSKGAGCFQYTSDGKYVVSGGDGWWPLRMYNEASGEELWAFKEEIYGATALDITPDDTNIVTGDDEGKLRIHRLEDGKLLHELGDYGDFIASIDVSPKGDLAVAAMGSSRYGGGNGKSKGALVVLDISRGEIEYQIEGHRGAINTAVFSPEGELIISGGEDADIRIWHAETGEASGVFSGHTGPVNTLAFSKDGSLLWSGSDDGTVQARDFASGRIEYIYREMGGKIKSISFSKENRYMLLGGPSKFRCVDLASGRAVNLLPTPTGGKWIIYTDDGYFDCSSNGSDLVSIISGMNVMGVDQIAVWRNRPDIILSRIGKGTEQEREYYRRQYRKRLIEHGLIPPVVSRAQFTKLQKEIGRSSGFELLFRKCYRETDGIFVFRKECAIGYKAALLSFEGFSDFVEDYYINETELPTARIADMEQSGKRIRLELLLKSPNTGLESYNLFVNDVPLFGSSGKPVSGKDVILFEYIELSAGENKIEVSCKNKDGIESYRDYKTAVYERESRGDLYFIGFGVSNYRNPDLNLLYPKKDVRNLETIFRGMDAAFEQVHIHTFTDANCTKAAILGVKSVLKNAKIDDTVVLFISGHGIHDTDPLSTYYFLTYETVLDNIAGTAAAFDSIEEILDGIEPRNKLFLMDTCQSGEFSLENLSRYVQAAKGKGLRPRTIPQSVLNTIDKSAEGKGINTLRDLENAFNRDSFINKDLYRRTGAVVFSSSRGNELSYEPEKYNEAENGFFTRAVIESLQGYASDSMPYGIITFDEMKSYVTEAVSRKTYGMQNPTVDRDNIYLNEVLQFPFEYKDLLFDYTYNSIGRVIMQFNPGLDIAAVISNGTDFLHVIDLETGYRRVLDLGIGLKGDVVHHLVFSSDGKYLLAAGARELVILDSDTLKEVGNFHQPVVSGRIGRITDVQADFTPDNSGFVWIVDKQITIYPGFDQDTHPIHLSSPSRVVSFDCSPEGEYIAFCNDRSGISVVDTKSWKTVKTFRGEFARFSPDGKHLLVKDGKKIELLDRETWISGYSLHGAVVEGKEYIFSPGGEYVLCTPNRFIGIEKEGENNDVILIEIETGIEVGIIESREFTDTSKNPNRIYAQFINQGRKVLYFHDGNNQQRVGVWDIGSKKKRERDISYWPHLDDFQFSPEGEYAMTTDSSDRPLKIWSVPLF
jgi:WD40 repeat protein